MAYKELFYDSFHPRLLADYAHGNKRVEAAIAFCLDNIPEDASNILDIGCGIGWSSHEIKRNRPGACVLGLDGSEKSIEIAAALFGRPGLSFQSGDALDFDGGGNKRDAIVMLDVYEHIERNRRDELHALLSRLLSDSGRLVLSFPSASHQAFLARERPWDLQPVDETVTREDIEKLASDTGRRIASFRSVSIWREGDYIHAALVKKGAGPEAPCSRGGCPALESPKSRAERAAKSLSLRVTGGGLLLPVRNDAARVCVAVKKDASYSETFIRAHARLLPFDMVSFEAAWIMDMKNTTSISGNLFSAAKAGLRRDFRGAYRGLSMCRDIWKARLSLRENSVDAVLAEYGLSAVRVARACHSEGIPLVAHFHGFDAHRRDVLEQYGSDYKWLFEKAAALVVVSETMRESLAGIGAPESKMRLVPYGVDTARFRPAKPSEFPPRFLAAGRFVDKKAPYLTLLAFNEVARKNADATMVMIGDGPLLDPCRRMAEALGISDRVEFAGRKDHGRVAFEMGRSRAFVQHSVVAADGDSEGTPVAVLEAGASGLPVVSTRHAGIVEAVRDGETGFLVEEGDVSGMARHMMSLIDDPGMADDMGAEARDFIEKNYSMERSINALAEVVEECLKRK